MPIPFYLCCLAFVGFGYLAYRNRWKAWGLPMVMSLLTVAVWYLGDVVYNDYEGYRETLGDEALTKAWWQVLLFVMALAGMVPIMHQLVNRDLLGMESSVMGHYRKSKFGDVAIQRKFDRMGFLIVSLWTILILCALVRVKGDGLGLLFPYLVERKVFPWARGQIGSGFSAVLSLAAYLQIFLVSSVGVLAALSRNPKTRSVALLVCVLAMPAYVFDRTRNEILAVCLPGILAFVLLRMRSGIWVKGMTLMGVFFIVHFWMLTIIQNRDGLAFDIGGALKAIGERKETRIRHAGLNMFEELGEIENLIKVGAYKPNLGARYFAELCNPIPRGLWKNKPTIGLDYAEARGQVVIGMRGEMAATISTGLIGQGVVNFGAFFGPIAAAGLMALWIAILARQDIKANHNIGRLIIYATGMVLTFNTGRDFSLLVLYPFVFGYVIIKISERVLRNA